MRGKRIANRVEAYALKQAKRFNKENSQGKRNTFSHLVMGGIMITYFVGVLLGIFVVIILHEPIDTVLSFIMELAKIVTLGYFVKAFGENIAKIVFSSIYGTQFNQSKNESGENNNG